MQTQTTSAIKPIYRRITLLTISLIALYIFIKIFPQINDLIVVIIISVFLTYIFKPSVVYLEHLNMPRVAAILSVFLAVIILVAVWGNFFVPRLIDEAALLANKLEQLDIAKIHEKVIFWLDDHFPGLSGLLGVQSGQAERWVEQVRLAATGYLQGTIRFVAGAFSVLGLSIVVPFLTFFLLKDGSLFTKRLIERVPNRFFEMTLSLAYRIDQQLGNYLRSILVESFIIGVLTWIAFAIAGIKFALVLGILHGLLNMIPFFGPMIAYLPIGAAVLLTYSPPLLGLIWMTIIMVIVQVIDNIVAKPLIISKSVNVHPAMVLLVVLVGGRLAGPLGMFVAVPAYAIIQAVFVDFYSHLKKYRII